MRRVLLFVCVLAMLAAGAPGDANAAARRAVFALQPVGQSGHAGYFVLDARPGTTLTRAVRVANTGGSAGTVRLYAVDATTGQTTGAVYRARSHAGTGAGAWIRLRAHELRLAPNQSRTVAFTVTIPRAARGGQHLGGVVAENAELTRGPTRRSGRGSFRIDVRSLTIVAVELSLPGNRREQMALTGVRPGGTGGRQVLLVGLRNDGNQLIKGRGELVVRDQHGTQLKHARFPVDTFVPRTQVADPVPVPGRALPAGRYQATVTLRYGHGRDARLDTRFTISDKQVAQVFGSRPQQAPSDQASGPPLLALLLGGLALLVLGFLAAVLLMRRHARVRSENPRSS